MKHHEKGYSYYLRTELDMRSRVCLVLPHVQLQETGFDPRLSGISYVLSRVVQVGFLQVLQIPPIPLGVTGITILNPCIFQDRLRIQRDSNQEKTVFL